MDLQFVGFLAIGLAAGWLSGLMGIGGGVIIVPALMFIYGFSLRDAQGTSLGAILAPVGILAAYTFHQNGNLNIKAAALIALGFFFGALLGAKTNYLIKREYMEKIFATLLILIAVRIFFKK
jgi:uncharacterized membrane protein YfcA